MDIKLSKDVVILTALKLNLSSILNLSLANSNFNRYICMNNSFWQQKVYNDFGILTTYESAKEEYKKYFEFTNDMFRCSSQDIPEGYDSLMLRIREIFNTEFKKLCIRSNNIDDNICDLIVEFVLRFISDMADNLHYYIENLIKLLVGTHPTI